MRTMQLTSKQIDKILADIKKQLESTRSTASSVTATVPLNKVKRKKANLVITAEAYNKMTALVDHFASEVAWHCTVSKNHNRYTVEDVFVFPQQVTGSTVTSDDTEYSLWLYNLPEETFNKLRMHGHSHVNMGVSPSGVDTQYQADIINNLQDFYIFLIMNKSRKMYVVIYDVADNIVYEQSDINITVPAQPYSVWLAEQTKLVKTKQHYADRFQNAGWKQRILEDTAGDYDYE